MVRRAGVSFRIFLFFLGLFVMGLGISFVIRADLGSSAVSSVPYILSLAFPLSFGMFTFILALIYIGGQVLVYGRGFPRAQYFQLLVSPVFGLFIDLGMFLTRPLVPDSYAGQILLLVLGCLLTALGIYFQLIAAVLVNAGEGIVRALAWKSRKPFGTVKILFDLALVALGLILSLIFFREVRGIREGTFISALLVGWMGRGISALGERLRFTERLGLRTQDS